jgi:hypothetical protein
VNFSLPELFGGGALGLILGVLAALAMIPMMYGMEEME